MSDEPIPAAAAVPLSYFDRSNEPWLPITRLLALAGAIDSGVSILSFLSLAGLIVWQSVVPTAARISYFGFTWQLALQLPAAIAATVLLVGAILALRLRRPGRQMVVGGALAWAALTLLLSLVTVGFSVIQYPSRYGWPFALSQLASTFLFGVQRCVLPIVLWILFRREPVKELFESANR
jgi:hypothetical protein